MAEPTWLEATLVGSDWTLADVDLTEPAGYRVNVRAFDNAGNHAQSSANPRTDFTVNADETIPSAETTFPANGSEVTAAVQSISGVATDADSGVSEVLVRVRRLGALAGFWSKSGWVAEPKWLEATLDGSDWTLADVDLTVPAGYRVNVRAFDNAGNHAQSSANPRTDFTVISVDETIPGAEATSPANGSEVIAEVQDISGVATDADSGVSEVLVRVRRLGASAGF